MDFKFQGFRRLYGKIHQCAIRRTMGQGHCQNRIQKGVRSVGAYAFRGCSKVKEVVFENNYNPIKFNYGAFYGCESLESFTFPDKTDYVSTQMFEKCYSLKSVKLFPSIKWIPQRFFKDCSSLGPEFILPETNTSIGLMAFELCSSLKR